MKNPPSKAKMFFSAFGLLFGGLLLVRVIGAVFLGLMDGNGVLHRILDWTSLAIGFISSLAVAGLWCQSIRRGEGKSR